MKVIAVSGWKRSGKDTLAEHLILKYAAKRVGFADPLKDTVAKQFDFDRAVMDSSDHKEKPILTLPVIASDGYTKHVISFLYKELRGPNGEVPLNFDFINNEIFGFNGLNGFRLYWTWRALCIQRGSSERVADSSYWVKQAIEKVNSEQLTVISDTRYKSEMQQLKEAFGDNLVTIRVNRFDSSESEDPSERDLDNYDFDYVIKNTGTLEEFYQNINELMTGYGRVMGLLYAK